MQCRYRALWWRGWVLTGKTAALLLEPLRHINNPGFGAVIFRRTTEDIRNEGALWDSSFEFYAGLGRPREHNLDWVFPSGAAVTFKGLQHEKDIYNFQGAQIALMEWDELTHFCMSPRHEVLTKTGWKFITEIKPGEEVASMSPEGDIEYEIVLENRSFDYDGDLIKGYQRNGVSFEVTPNHRMVVESQSKSKLWKFIRADHMEKTIQVIPRVGKWKGKDKQGKITFSTPKGRGHGTNSNNSDGIPIDDYLELLGWYLSEGCAFVSRNSPRITIRQTKECASLLALFERLPYRTFISKDGNYSIFSRQLYEHFKPMGNLYQKRIPRWVFNLSVTQMEIFWDAFIKGDGHITKDGATQIGLANSGLIDDLQELAFLMGLVSTRRTSIIKTGFTVHSLSVSKKRSRTFIKPESITRIKHVGQIHCLIVNKNHTFFTRLDGRTHWTGNSRKQFFYMISRNRSTCGIKPYVRGSLNPDPDSWVFELLGPWVDDACPFYGALPGEIRWFTHFNDELQWVPEGTPDAKSIAYFPAKIYDNKILMEKDPGYITNLRNLGFEDQQRLLHGLWTKLESPGALWSRANIDRDRVKLGDQPSMVRTVVAIDPQAMKKEDSDETGIIVAGKGIDTHHYTLCDRSGNYKPLDWARQAVWAFHRYNCSCIVAEQNQGGEMIRTTIQTVEHVPVKLVPATVGKEIRAEPVSAMSAQGRDHHVGTFPTLEGEMTRWVPGKGMPSPNRLDAKVYADLELDPTLAKARSNIVTRSRQFV